MVQKYIIAILLATVSVQSDRYMWIPDEDNILHKVDMDEDDYEDYSDGTEDYSDVTEDYSDVTEDYSDVIEGNSPPKNDVAQIGVPFLQSFNGEKDVTLNLYTRKSPSTPQRIKLKTIPSNFNAAYPTRIVMHGYLSDALHMDAIRRAYLNTEKDINIIMVDWSSLSYTLRYFKAKTSAIRVGKYLAKVVKNLVSNGNLSLDDLYLIGHSLGAHGVGVCGHNLNGQVSRIYGLDAAAPGFGSERLSRRIDRTDGRFVEGIHTNGGFLGWYNPFGHADFYPNGGSIQAGCKVLFQAPGTCNHARSYKFYAESINSNNFIGTKCKSYTSYVRHKCSDNPKAIMGEGTFINASGSYYLATNSKPPYARGLDDHPSMMGYFFQNIFYRLSLLFSRYLYIPFL